MNDLISSQQITQSLPTFINFIITMIAIWITTIDAQARKCLLSDTHMSFFSIAFCLDFFIYKFIYSLAFALFICWRLPTTYKIIVHKTWMKIDNKINWNGRRMKQLFLRFCSFTPSLACSFAYNKRNQGKIHIKLKYDEEKKMKIVSQFVIKI